MAAITPATDTTPPDTNLSWPALFWAMTNIALNTMAQPTGKTLGFPAKYNFFVRSSPIICGAHVLYTLLQLLIYGIQNSQRYRRHNVLARLIAKNYEDAEPESTFAATRKGVRYVAVAFAIGALLVAIKLFSVRGIVASQVYCGFYLAAFVLDELVVVLAPKETRGRNAVFEDMTVQGWDVLDWLAATGLLVGDIFGIVVCCRAFASTLIRHHGLDFIDAKLTLMIVVPIIAALNIALLPSAVVLLCFDTTIVTRRQHWYAAAFSSIASVAFVAVVLVPLYTLYSFMPVWPFIMIGTSLLFMTGQHLLHVVLDAHWVHTDREKMYVFFVSFAVTHLLAALLWYWQAYDPTVTYIPPWTGYLG